jgi:glycosyltransferase involved in cell wall biosynthesis
MRIGFDAKRAFLNKAGLGNYSRNTLVALHKYFPQHHYLLFTPEYRTDIFREYLFFDTVSPVIRLLPVFNSLWRSFYLSGKIKKSGLDLFHGLSNELPSWIQKSGVPSVVTIHDLIFMNFPGLYKAIDRRIYYEKVKYACEYASRIIATSHQTRNDLIHHLRVDPEKVEVIYQSISERFFLKYYMDDLDEVRKRYNLPENFILTVGTIEPRKNQLGVLKAIHQHHIDIPYVIIGKITPYKEQILEYVKKYHLQNSVYFLHNVPDFDLPAIYHLATCMVYLSHYEGFGLPLVEAMACGCPVITSSVSSLPEIGDDSALYCNPEDEETVARLISKLINNPVFASEMGSKGENRAQLFHPEARINDLMAFYKKVVVNE